MRECKNGLLSCSRRVLALMLAALMLVSVLPVASLAQETGDQTSAAQTDPTATEASSETTAPTEETTQPTQETTQPTEETTQPTEDPSVAIQNTLNARLDALRTYLEMPSYTVEERAALNAELEAIGLFCEENGVSELTEDQLNLWNSLAQAVLMTQETAAANPFDVLLAAGTDPIVIDLTGIDQVDMAGWTGGYHGSRNITITGKTGGTVLKNLSVPLLAMVRGGTVQVSNLIVDGAAIQDQVGGADTYLGAIIGYMDAQTNATITGCVVKNSRISSDYDNTFVGGIVGWSDAVKLTVDGCSVIDSTLLANDAGVVGGIGGTLDASANSVVTIQNSTGTGCTITNAISSGAGSYKAGAIISTGNAGKVTIANCKATGNTISSNGVAIQTPVGRCRHSGDASTTISGGTYDISEDWLADLTDCGLVVTGGTFSHQVPAQFLAEGLASYPNDSGAWVVGVPQPVAQVGEDTYLTLEEAMTAAVESGTQELTQVKLLKNLTGAGFDIDKSIALDLGGFTYTVTGSDGISLAAGKKILIQNGKITSASAGTLLRNAAELIITGMELSAPTNVMTHSGGTANFAAGNSVTATGAEGIALNVEAPGIQTTLTAITGGIRVSGTQSDSAATGLTLISGTTVTGMLLPAEQNTIRVSKSTDVTLAAPVGYEWILSANKAFHNLTAVKATVDGEIFDSVDSAVNNAAANNKPVVAPPPAQNTTDSPKNTNTVAPELVDAIASNNASAATDANKEEVALTIPVSTTATVALNTAATNTVVEKATEGAATVEQVKAIRLEVEQVSIPTTPDPEPAPAKAAAFDLTLTVDNLVVSDFTDAGANQDAVVTVTLPLPADMKGAQEVRVRYHNGTDFENKNYDATTNGETFSFTTNHFSTYVVEVIVAGVGPVQYTDLQTAIDAAGENGVVTLKDDAELTAPVTIGKSLTLELNGKTLSGKGMEVTGGTLTLRGGTVTGTTATSQGADKTANILLKGGSASLLGVTLNGGIYGVFMEEAAKAASLYLDNTQITATHTGVVATTSEKGNSVQVESGTVNGGVVGIANVSSPVDAAPTDAKKTSILVRGGTVKGGTTGIANPRFGDVNVTGGKVEGATGIAMGDGSLYTSGGTIQGTATGIYAEPLRTPVINQDNVPYYILSVTVDGGKVIGTTASLEVKDPKGNNVAVSVYSSTLTGPIRADSAMGRTAELYMDRYVVVTAPDGYEWIDSMWRPGYTLVVKNPNAAYLKSKITVVWDDNKNVGKKRPESMTLYTTVNGYKVYDEKNPLYITNGYASSASSNKWELYITAYDYQDLQFKLSCAAVPNYTTQITGSLKNGYVITNTLKKTPYTSGTVSQTGQLNWPVPVLAGAGLSVLATGMWLMLRKKKDSYEI